MRPFEGPSGDECTRRMYQPRPNHSNRLIFSLSLLFFLSLEFEKIEVSQELKFNLMIFNGDRFVEKTEA